GNLTMPHDATDLEISPAQLQAIAALISGASVTDAAKAAGCDRATVHRWLRSDPAFIADYATARAEILEQVRREGAALGKQAVKEIRDCLAAQGAHRALRVKTALAVLKMLGLDRPEAVKRMSRREAELEIRRREDDLEDDEDRLDLLGMIRGRMAVESSRT